ncbi:MAG: four helix bundle protein [Muribaculaceae bacterium]|nr:four helix bundle protein [Muribaculaceae bacterium]
MKSNDFRQLLVWQKSMDLTVEIYRLTKLLPREEMFSLSNQMRRAVVSIPSNLAEGQGRNSKKDCVNFNSIARGSLWELSTQLEICERLNYLSEAQTAEANQLITEISKMITALSNSLMSSISNI